MATSQQLAQAMRYGPQVQQQMRRSAYLEDALKALSAPQQDIRSPWELAAKLAGVALLDRASGKAKDATAEAVRASEQQRLQRLLADLPDPVAQPVPPPPPQPQAQPVGPVAQAPMPQHAPQPGPMQPTPAAQFRPEDRDAMIRMLVTEAGGEGPEGMAAAGHVALNRLKTGYGDAKSLRDVVYARHQFEGMSRANQVKPEDYERVAPIADAILSGQLPDPTGGAVNFINPDLQVQMGRAIPQWARGEGQRIGRHVFFGGKPQAVAQAPQPPQQPPFDVSEVAAGAQPFQLAANGPLQPGMIPSAPDSSPSASGAPPVATPQAAAGGNSVTYQPTAQEVMYVKRLLSSGDPEQQARGEAAYWKLMEKMVEPQKWESITVNGIPGQQNPYTGEVRLSQVPEGARTRTVPNAPGLTPGTVAQEDPTGKISVIQAPPAGFQGPPQQQSYIRGGPQDPAAGANLITNEGKLRDDYEKQIKDYSAAREGYQKVVQAAKTGTPAGDIALVFGYMKTLDPGSTVREGEAATIQNSGTVPQTIQNMYNKLLTGEGSLLPAQRQQFASSAAQQFEVYQRTADALNERYGALAQSYGFDPGRIVRQFEPIEPYRAPAQASPAQVRTLQGLKGYDPKAQLGSPNRPFVAMDDATVKQLDKPENKGKHIVLPNGDLGVID